MNITQSIFHVDYDAKIRSELSFTTLEKKSLTIFLKNNLKANYSALCKMEVSRNSQKFWFPTRVAQLGCCRTTRVCARCSFGLGPVGPKWPGSKLVGRGPNGSYFDLKVNKR